MYTRLTHRMAFTSLHCFILPLTCKHFRLSLRFLSFHALYFKTSSHLPLGLVFVFLFFCYTSSFCTCLPVWSWQRWRIISGGRSVVSSPLSKQHHGWCVRLISYSLSLNMYFIILPTHSITFLSFVLLHSFILSLKILLHPSSSKSIVSVAPSISPLPVHLSLPALTCHLSTTHHIIPLSAHFPLLIHSAGLSAWVCVCVCML